MVMNKEIKLKYICIIKYKNGFYCQFMPFCYSIINKGGLK